MNRIAAFAVVAFAFTASAYAQSTPPAQKPKPGTIVGTESGRITEAPPSTPATTAAGAGQRVERFEAVGNTSVASDTIRVYLGINPGEPFDPAAVQKNFLNLWQTGLFDDIRVETEKGPN